MINKRCYLPTTQPKIIIAKTLARNTVLFCRKLSFRIDMEVFKLNRDIFIAIGVCEHVKGTTRLKKVLSFLTGLFLFAVNSFSLFTSLIFISRYMNVDFESTLYAMFQASAILTVWYILGEAFFYRTEMASVFVMFSEFYGKSKCFNSTFFSVHNHGIFGQHQLICKLNFIHSQIAIEHLSNILTMRIKSANNS